LRPLCEYRSRVILKIRAEARAAPGHFKIAFIYFETPHSLRCSVHKDLDKSEEESLCSLLHSKRDGILDYTHEAFLAKSRATAAQG